MGNSSFSEGSWDQCEGTGLAAPGALTLHPLPTPRGPALFRQRARVPRTLDARLQPQPPQSYVTAAVTVLQPSALTKTTAVYSTSKTQALPTH